MNYNEVYQRFKEKGLILLDKQYIRNDVSMKCMDKDGYLFSISLNNLDKFKLNKIADNRNPYVLYNIQRYIDLNTDGATVLNTEWHSAKKDKVKLQCNNCKNIFELTWAYIHRRNMVTCPFCAKKNGSPKRLNIIEVKQRLNSYGLKLLDNCYISNNSKLLCEDNDGYLVYIKIMNLGKKPYRFSTKFNKENYIYNVNHYFELHNINCKALYLNGEKQGEADVIICQCECGNEFHTTLDSIKQGQYRCQCCSKHISKAEYKMIQWLNEHQIQYIHQYKTEQCKIKRCLPFDFYIPNLNLIIEIDGEQHKKPTPFGGDWDNAYIAYKHTVKSDDIKNKYCEENNIKLIRLESKLFRNNQYKEILTKLFY